jgi:hypothetical protein
MGDDSPACFERFVLETFTPLLSGLSCVVFATLAGLFWVDFLMSLWSRHRLPPLTGSALHGRALSRRMPQRSRGMSSLVNSEDLRGLLLKSVKKSDPRAGSVLVLVVRLMGARVGFSGGLRAAIVMPTRVFLKKKPVRSDKSPKQEEEE